jgi:hypothetical protein
MSLGPTNLLKGMFPEGLVHADGIGPLKMREAIQEEDEAPILKTFSSLPKNRLQIEEKIPL